MLLILKRNFSFVVNGRLGTTKLFTLYTFGVAVHPRSSVDRVSDEAVAGELVSYDSGDDRS